MSTKVMVYIYDNIKYPAQIKFAVAGFDTWETGHFDDEAENMLVSLFNDQANKWHLNSDWEDESLAENYDEYGVVRL
jgi:hypothetical protein